MSVVPFGAAASSVICQQLYLPACQHGNTRRRGGVSLRARGAGPCFSSSPSIHHGADRRRPTRFDASAPGDLHPNRRHQALINTTASPSPVARMLHHPRSVWHKMARDGAGFRMGDDDFIHHFNAPKNFRYPGGKWVKRKRSSVWFWLSSL